MHSGGIMFKKLALSDGAGRAQALIYLGIFAAMLLFNLLTPMLADDFIYRFSLADWNVVDSVSDIVKSLAVLRVTTNGRVFSHFFAMLFLLLPRWVFIIVNSLVAVLLFHLASRFVSGEDRRLNAALSALAFAMVWVLLPAFGQVFFWLTGACNYSWNMVFSLLFLSPFFARFMERGSISVFDLEKKSHVALHIPLAFIAGAYSENGSFSMLGIAFLLLSLTFRREKRLPRALLPSFISACGGFLFMMLSPSELNGRRGEAGASTFAKNLPVLVAAARRALSGIPAALLWGAVAALLAAAVALIVIGVKKHGGRKAFSAAALVITLGFFAAMAALIYQRSGGVGALELFKAVVSSVKLDLLVMFSLSLCLLCLAIFFKADARLIAAAVVFILGAAASVLIFIFAKYFPARSACPATFYTTIASLLLLSGLFAKGKKHLFTGFSAVALALFAVCFAVAVPDNLTTHSQASQRLELINAARETGGDLVVPPVTPETKYSPFWPGDQIYFNNDIAMYYGLKSFSVTEYVE